MVLTDPSKIAPNVLHILHQSGMTDDEISWSSTQTLMDRWLQYEGIIGYTDRIIFAYERIKGAQVQK